MNLFDNKWFMNTNVLNRTRKINSIQVLLNNVCNLNCFFCVTNKSKKIELDYRRLIKLFDAAKTNGVKTIEFTGGGEPTLYTHFTEAIGYIDKSIKIGLITNGSTLSVIDTLLLDRFSWVRVSINGHKENYQKVCGCDRYDNIIAGMAKHNYEFSVSYVWNKYSSISDIKKLYDDLDKKTKLKFLRITPDIADHTLINGHIDAILNISKKIRYRSIPFGQVPLKCLSYQYKPVVDCDGGVYPCCHAAFESRGKICEVEDINNLENSPYIDTKLCKYCLYFNANQFLSLDNDNDSDFL